MAGGIIEGQWHTRLSSARYTQEDISKGVILWHLMLTRQKTSSFNEPILHTFVSLANCATKSDQSFIITKPRPHQYHSLTIIIFLDMA